MRNGVWTAVVSRSMDPSMAGNLRTWSTLPLVGVLPGGDAGDMFPIECPVHGSRVLVPASRIRSLHNTTDGILLEVECWCGTHVQLHTGRHQAVMPTRTARVAVSLSR